MAEVSPRDVLLRVSTKNLERYQSLVTMGAGRGRARPVPFTFARADATPCAPYLGQDGKLYVAAADKLRIDYTPYVADGLVWADGTPMGGLALGGSRTNLVTWSDALSNWSSSGSPPAVTDAFATLGDLGLTLIEDDDATNAEFKQLNTTFTGNGVKGVLFYLRAPDTPGDGNLNSFRVFDVTAAAFRLVVPITWNADGTLAGATATTGTTITTKKLGTAGGKPVYAIYCQTTSVTAANTNQLRAEPAGETVANVGKMVIGGVMVENALFPSLHRIKTTGSTATRAADSLTVPCNFGPTSDLTVLYRSARPVWADAGTLAAGPRVYRIGTAAPLLHAGVNSTQTHFANIDTATTDGNAPPIAVQAGAELVALAQYKNLLTGGQAAQDVGTGLTAFSSAATAFTQFANQTVQIGGPSNAEWFGVLTDLVIARGLYSRQEMLAIP